MKSFYYHFFIFHLTQGVCVKVKRRKKTTECFKNSERSTQDFFETCKEADFIFLDLANKYFPWKLGDRMSPMNAVST